MNDELSDPKRPLVEPHLSARKLPNDIKQNRERFKVQNQQIERIAAPRIQAQLRTYRLIIDQLVSWHRQIADETDLDLTGYSRASALWLLSGRSLGLLETLYVLAEAGIEVEAMVIGRTLHETDSMLLAFLLTAEEDLLRLWLDDAGRHKYVRPSAAHKAHFRFEDELSKEMERRGLTPGGSTSDLVEEVYDGMSRVAHSRRSTCVSSLEDRLRQFSYGHHESVVRRAAMVEWLGSMTGEVLNAVGDTLRGFFGADFFGSKIAPLVQSIAAVRVEAQLGRDALIKAAMLEDA